MCPACLPSSPDSDKSWCLALLTASKRWFLLASYFLRWSCNTCSAVSGWLQRVHFPVGCFPILFSVWLRPVLPQTCDNIFLCISSLLSSHHWYMSHLNKEKRHLPPLLSYKWSIILNLPTERALKLLFAALVLPATSQDPSNSHDFQKLSHSINNCFYSLSVSPRFKRIVNCNGQKCQRLDLALSKTTFNIK